METILSGFPDVDGTTVLAAIALPPSLLTTYNSSQLREIHLIHHADDKLCVWTPSNHDIKLLSNEALKSRMSQDGERTLALHSITTRIGLGLPSQKDDGIWNSWKASQGYSPSKCTHKLLFA